jgi:membrane fusion protein (multidrug efflux system)
MKPDSNRSKLRVYVPLAIVIIIVLAGVWYWYRDFSRYITTDDAHVDADNVNVSVKIMGRLVSLHADEGDMVRKGELLAEIDSSDFLAQRNQALAQRSLSQANLAQAEVKYASDQKSLRVLEINLERASDDLARAKNQAEGGVITPEQFDHSNKAYETAAAQLDAARSQLLVSKSMIASASAALASSGAQVKVLDSQMKNFRLYAPADGIIARRWLLSGDIIQPGQSLFTITLSKDLWVSAFLEETKIAEIKNGQDVRISIDAFPGTRFNGKVFLIGSSTASVFSLIPANNASGNFTKVTQRIPIRISIESTEDNKDVSSFDILSGMSVVVKIVK